MKTSAIVFTALMSLALTSPVTKRQDIDFAAYESTDFAPNIEAPAGSAATSTITYNPTSAATAAAAVATSDAAANSKLAIRDVAKRGSCQPNVPNAGAYYQVNAPAHSDTPDAFLAYQPFANAANGAATPAGYNKAPGFQNLKGAASNPSYMTYTTTDITSYNPQVCADKCTAMAGCNAFNIFFERDPNLQLDNVNCPTAAHSVTLIKCSFFGSALTSSDATNVGQYTGANPSFHIVIAGSNAYIGTPAPQHCYSGPVSIGGAIIQVPDGDDSYMGIQTFPTNTPFDPYLCAAACNAKSAYNQAHTPAGTTVRICRFFDAYILYKNGQNGVFSCTFYTKVWGTAQATNVGQYDGSGNHFTPSHSYTYSLTSDNCPTTRN